MKKLLFIINHLQYSNGVATALKGYVNELVKRDYQVDIVCLFLCEEDFVKKEIDPRVRVIKSFNRYFRGFSRLIDLIPNKLLYKKLVKDKYDVEIAFQFGLPTKILSASPNPNKVAWIHGYGEGHLKEHEKYSHVIACAKDSVNKYKKVFKFPERIGYLYNPIKEDLIIEKSERPCAVVKEPQKFVYGAVGRLSPEKGYERLIRVFSKIAKEVPDSELWIVGDGPERKNLENAVAELAMEGRVKLLGGQDNPYNFIKQFDIFICSSYNEGFSTVCVEALMLKVPCISTFVGGSEELIKNYGCGEVVYSDEELGQTMLKVYKNEALIEGYRSHIGDNKELLYNDRIGKIINFFEAL